jgi:hypothetical protein
MLSTLLALLFSRSGLMSSIGAIVNGGLRQAWLVTNRSQIDLLAQMVGHCSDSIAGELDLRESIKPSPPSTHLQHPITTIKTLL